MISPADPFDPEMIARLLRSRRTVHQFKPDKPPIELVRQGIEAARWAPNHKLTQPWRFYLLGPETATRIAEFNAELAGASGGSELRQKKRERWLAIPGWIVVTCAKSADAIQSQEDYAACCCAIQNFSLFMWSHGVGVKWTTGAVTRTAEFCDIVWIDPAVEMVVGMLWYGYPADKGAEAARKPLSQIIVELP